MKKWLFIYWIYYELAYRYLDFHFSFPIMLFRKLLFQLLLRFIAIYIRLHKLLYCITFYFTFQAIDLFMSSCMIFVFLSLIEYAFVNVMMGDISDGKFLNIWNKTDSFYIVSICLGFKTNIFIINLKILSWAKGQNRAFKEHYSYS